MSHPVRVLPEVDPAVHVNGSLPISSIDKMFFSRSVIAFLLKLLSQVNMSRLNKIRMVMLDQSHHLIVLPLLLVHGYGQVWLL